MKYFYGEGLVNTIINKLPFEMHIPGYNYCGPGTKLRKRLDRGDRGVNPLDESCRRHDQFYANEQDLSKRHQADQTLAREAFERVRSTDASIGEKVAGLAVTGAMKAKVKLGLGYTTKNINQNSIRKCLKIFNEINTSLQNVKGLVANGIGLLNSNNLTEQTKRVYNKKMNVVKPKQRNRHRNKLSQIEVMEVDDNDITPVEFSSNSADKKGRKRKLDDVKMSSDEKIPRKKTYRKRKLLDGNNDDSIAEKKLKLSDPIILPIDYNKKRKIDEDVSYDDDENLNQNKRQRIE